MEYEECIHWLTGRGRFRIKPGLRRVREMFEELGCPPDQIPGVLVAGTNGKGSTCAMAVAALAAAGYRVGSTPSPHLQDYTERVRINGVPVTRAQFAGLIKAVQAPAERLDRLAASPTEFEVLTAASYLHFLKVRADLLMIEVGLGGLHDATNILDLGVKVITSIALDHQDFLGGTLASIARNKAGIVRPGDDVVIGELPDEARTVVQEVISRQPGCRALWASRHIFVADHGETIDVATPYAQHRDLPPPLRGAHQKRNLALAVAAVDALCHRFILRAPTDAQWRTALASMQWPGRLEWRANVSLTHGWSGSLVLDGAHNPHALKSVISELATMLGRAPVVIFAAMRDKAIADMLEHIPQRWPLVLTTVPGERAAAPADLARLTTDRAVIEITGKPMEALDVAAAAAAPDRPIAVLGSLYLVGAVRNCLGLSAL